MWKGPSPTRARPKQVLACALLLLLAGGATASELRAGFGSAPLPAPDGAPLAGYGGLRDRIAHGLADPPQARALVLERGDLRVALVVLDLVMMRPSLRDALLEPAHALDIDALIAVATHTHSGPGGYVPGFVAERVTAGSYRPEALEGLAAAAQAALEGAAADLAPARAASGRTTLDLARNRRREDGPRESELPVLRVDFDPPRQPVVVFGYGMHPTVRSPASRVYSADYVGAARAALAALGWRAIFVPGPLGDQGPSSALGRIWPGDLKLEQRQTIEVGALVAGAVNAAAAQLEPGPDARLAVLERWAEPPPVRLRRFCALWWLAPVVRGSVRRFVSPSAPIHALQVGDARLIALPAEPGTELGDAIRARAAPGTIPFVVAHANDWLGYAVTREEYERGGYEPCLSLHGAGLGAWLVDTSGETLDALEARNGG